MLVVVAAPTEPRAFRVRLAQSSPPTAEVTWQAPLQSFGEILSYKLVYFVRGDDEPSGEEFPRIKPEERRLVTNSLSE